MRKLIKKQITLALGATAGSRKEQVSFDSNIAKILSMEVYETANTTNDYEIGLSENGSAILQPVTRLAYTVSTAVPPSMRGRELNIEKTSQTYDIDVNIPATIVTADVKFTVVFDCETLND